ncbi:MAG: hypothetical protein ACPGQS_05925 [Bradymonadia bacterium]
MNESKTLEFQFRQALFPVNVQIKNDVVCVRYSIKYFEVPLKSLVFIYLDEDPNREMLELILCAKDERGRYKRTRIFSDRDAQDFHALVAFLSSLLGTGHLRDIEREQAYEMMGAKDQTHVYVPIMISFCLLFVGAMMHSSLIHGLDGDVKTTTIAELQRPNSKTNHIEIKQPTVDLNTAVFEPKMPTAEKPLESQWHPVYDSSVSRQSIQLVAQFHARHGVPEPTPETLSGLIRRVGFERVPDHIRQAFLSQGMQLGDQLLYLEVGAHPKDELIFFIGVMGILSAMGGAIVFTLHRRRQERTAYLARKAERAARKG